jgi:hypothetical protein
MGVSRVGVDNVVMGVVGVVDEMDMVNVVNGVNMMNGLNAVNVKTVVTYVTRRSNLVALCSISGQSTMDPSTHQHTPHCGSGSGSSGGVRSGAARAALDGLKITGRGRRVHGSRAVGVLLSVQCSAVAARVDRYHVTTGNAGGRPTCSGEGVGCGPI